MNTPKKILDKINLRKTTIAAFIMCCTLVGTNNIFLPQIATATYQDVQTVYGQYDLGKGVIVKHDGSFSYNGVNNRFYYKNLIRRNGEYALYLHHNKSGSRDKSDLSYPAGMIDIEFDNKDANIKK